MHPLDKRFETEQKAFTRLRKLCESQVVRWEYWSSEYWHWDPEKVFQSSGYTAERTSKDEALAIYGYDKLGRVVVIREGCLWEKKEDSINHHFLRYSDNKLNGTQFYGDRLWVVFEAELKGDQVLRMEQTGFGHEMDWKIIKWKTGKVERVLWGYGKKARVETVYDQNGKVVKETELEKRKPLPKGVTLKSLDKEICERLVQAVVKTVTQLKLKKPVYCLALNYDCEGNPIMPPLLGVGLDSERQARLKKGGRYAKVEIWSPEQMSLFAKEKTEEVIFDDKKLQKACDYYNRLLEKKGDNAPAHKLLNEIAAELGRMDWTGKLNSTDDFIAYAVDTDLADLQKNLKQSVPADRLKKLKEAKML